MAISTYFSLFSLIWTIIIKRIIWTVIKKVWCIKKQLKVSFGACCHLKVWLVTIIYFSWHGMMRLTQNFLSFLFNFRSHLHNIMIIFLDYFQKILLYFLQNTKGIKESLSFDFKFNTFKHILAYFDDSLLLLCHFIRNWLYSK